MPRARLTSLFFDVLPCRRAFTGAAGWFVFELALTFGLYAAYPGASCAAASIKPPPPPAASALYQKTLDADALYSYSGREFETIWDEDGRSTTTIVRISHQAPGEFRFAYSAPARYRGWVILQVGKNQWTYVPQKNEVLQGARHIPASRAPAAKFSLLSKNYLLRVNPHPTRIADRKAYELSMMSRATGKPLHRIWIDPYTGIVVRREDLRPDGSYAAVSYYSDIQFKPTFPKNLFAVARLAKPGARFLHMGQPKKGAASAAAIRLPVARIKAALGSAAVVPPKLGRYVLQGAVLMTDGTNPATLEIHYSDGLKALSLSESLRTSRYPTTVPGSRPVIFARGQVGRGARRHGFNLLNWDTARLNLTLVGDVSMQTLAALAREVNATPSR